MKNWLQKLNFKGFVYANIIWFLIFCNLFFVYKVDVEAAGSTDSFGSPFNFENLTDLWDKLHAVNYPTDYDFAKNEANTLSSYYGLSSDYKYIFWCNNSNDSFVIFAFSDVSRCTISNIRDVVLLDGRYVLAGSNPPQYTLNISGSLTQPIYIMSVDVRRNTRSYSIRYEDRNNIGPFYSRSALPLNFDIKVDDVLFYQYKNTDLIDKILNFSPTFSPTGALLESGFHNGDTLSAWNKIKTFIPDLVDMSNLSGIDYVIALLKNLLYYIGQVFYYLLRIYDDVFTFFNNFWTNLQKILNFLFNGLLGLFSEEDYPDGVDLQSYFTWIDGALEKFGNALARYIFGQQLFQLSLDDDGLFDFWLMVRRLIVPDDFNNISNAFSSVLDNELSSADGMYKNYLLSYQAGINKIQGNITPTFTIPSFELVSLGVTIPEQVISFAFFESYLPMIHNFISIFMYMGFVIYILKELPSIIRGSASVTEDIKEVR